MHTEIDGVYIDSRHYYGGRSNDYEVRALLGLPKTKDLFYIGVDGNKTFIKKYRIVQVYTVSRFWATLELILDDGRNIRINSMFLAEMQKPDFKR